MSSHKMTGVATTVAIGFGVTIGAIFTLPFASVAVSRLTAHYGSVYLTTFRSFVKWLYDTKYDKCAETLAAQYMLDPYGACNETDEDRPRPHRIPYKYATVAKARFGVQPLNKINRLAVRDFLRRKMEDDDVRTADIAKYLDQAVALSFVKTDDELIADSVQWTMTSWLRDTLFRGDQGSLN